MTPVVLHIFVHVKGLQREKAQSPRQRELLSPAEKTILHCLNELAGSQAFTSVNYVRHYVSGDICKYIFIYHIIYGCITAKVTSCSSVTLDHTILLGMTRLLCV